MVIQIVTQIILMILKQVIQTSSVTAFISVAVSGVDMEKDECIVVGYPSGWYPGQFVQFDCKKEEININFLYQSSSNCNCFIWLELSGINPDISW